MNQTTLSSWQKWLVGSRLPGILNFVLVGWLAYLGAALTWQLLPQPEMALPPTLIEPTAATAPTAQPASQLAAEITRLHLLGNPSNPAAENKPATANAPETKLNLSLKGVLAYQPQEGAMAIISQGNGEEKIYSVGDEVPGNALLAEVHPDRVVLERSGRYEVLRLPEEAPIFGARPRNAANTTSGAANLGSGGDVTANLVGISPSELRDRIQRDPTAFARQVSYIPVREGGKQIGIKIRARGNEDVLAQFGVQPDDVLVEVNGTRLDSMQAGRRLLRDLTVAKTIEAKVLRNGVEVPLFISME